VVVFEVTVTGALTLIIGVTVLIGATVMIGVTTKVPADIWVEVAGYVLVNKWFVAVLVNSPFVMLVKVDVVTVSRADNVVEIASFFSIMLVGDVLKVTALAFAISILSFSSFVTIRCVIFFIKKKRVMK